jgi:prepilin-type processing-associated H-X9-DG protein
MRVSKALPRKRLRVGLSRVDLLAIVLLCLFLAVPLLLSAMSRNGTTSKRVRCANNLKQLGLAFKTRALDHGDTFALNVVAQSGLTRGTAEGLQAYKYFQIMSNELADPKVLICPADTRTPAERIGAGFSNSNLSYFFGIDAVDTNPQMVLIGDRNLTNGPLPANRTLVINTNLPVGWTGEMHRNQGNIGLADGSVQQYSDNRLREALVNSAWTNRLAFP